MAMSRPDWARVAARVRRRLGGGRPSRPVDPWPWPQRVISRERVRGLVVAGILVAVGLGLGVSRVVSLEMHELEHVSTWQRLAPTRGGDGRDLPVRELTRVRLARGEDVTFEVCAQDAMRDGLWEGAVDFTVWHLDSDNLVLRTSLDQGVLAQARRRGRDSCLVIARGGHLEVGGQYAVAAVWPGRDLPLGLREVPVRARVLARRPLQSADLWPVALIMMGVFLAALCLTPARRSPFPSWGARAAPSDSPTAFGAGHEVLQVAVSLAALVASGVVVALMPLQGAAGILFRGLSLAVVQLAVCGTLVAVTSPPPGGRRVALGLVPPERAPWLVWFAPAIGLGLWLLGRLLLGLLPAAGGAPLEAAAIWPSGRLAVALVGVLVPLVEEVFFRGFLFGAFQRRWGGAAAFAATTAIFALAHLPQCWGAWGALSAIVLLGLALSAMRWWSGSVVAPALAHIVYNGSITILSIASVVLR